MATYYVDTSASDDNGAGTSLATAWKTIAKVNATSFGAGDSVLLKRGCVWRESLLPPSAGGAGNQIIFGAYGSGAKPSIRGSDLKNTAGDWTQDTNAATLTELKPAAADDGCYSTVANSFDVGYNSLSLGGWDSGTAADSVFARIQLNVPKNATISNASITVRCSHTKDAGTLALKIRAEAADNAAVPTGYADAGGRSKTTAGVDWDLATFTSGQDYTSGDISAVIQEVVNRAGWVSGNYITIYILDDGSGAIHSTLVSRDSSATTCPRLTLTYDAGASMLWYLASITADPEVLAHDGALGARKALKASLGAQWDYWWDDPNDRFYVYSTANPTTLATNIEIGVRNRILGYTGTSYIRFQDLDIRHNRGDETWGGWGALGVEFLRCDFLQCGQALIQYHNGSTGSVSFCTVTDWGIVDGQMYAVQVIGSGVTASGPVDVDDNTFAINHNSNATEIGAAMCDQLGNLRSFQRNSCDGRVGTWARDAVTIWRPKGMTTCAIADNKFYRMGGIAIALQELETNGDHPTITVLRNYVEDACNGDAADTEAIRLRDFSASCDVTVAYNVINRTKGGANAHEGIRASTATNPALGAKVFHNVVIGCDTGIAADTTSSLVARNNVCTANRVAAGRKAAGATLTETNNCWNGARTGFIADATSITTDPLLDANYRILKASPCRDAGVVIANIGQVVHGAAPDMGAYEWQRKGNRGRFKFAVRMGI